MVPELAVATITQGASDLSGVPVDALDDLQSDGGNLNGFGPETFGCGTTKTMVERGFRELSALFG